MDRNSRMAVLPEPDCKAVGTEVVAQPDKGTVGIEPAFAASAVPTRQAAPRRIDFLSVIASPSGGGTHHRLDMATKPDVNEQRRDPDPTLLLDETRTEAVVDFGAIQAEDRPAYCS
jgi:hypothetical protein